MSTDYLGVSALKREGYVKKYWEALANSLNQNPAERLNKMRSIDFENAIIPTDFQFPVTVGSLLGMPDQTVRHCIRLFGCFIFLSRTVGFGSSGNYLSSLKGIIQVLFDS
jgi:hypothetical protein